MEDSKGGAQSQIPDDVEEKLFSDIVLPTSGTFATNWILGLSLIVLLFAVVIASPPLSHSLLSKSLTPKIQDAKHWKLWTDYSKLVLETLLAVCIGGSVFAESIKGEVRRQLDLFADRTRDAGRRSINAYQSRLKTQFDQFKVLSTNVKSKRTSVWRAALDFASLSLRAYETTIKFPAIVRDLLPIVLAVNFPGRLFGFFAYVILVLLVLLKGLKLHIDGM